MHQGDPALDVTLHRLGARRFWRVEPHRRSGYWNYERRSDISIAFGELATLKDALDKRREFEAEITTALSEGWA
jgi:hypothetical protein